MTLSDCSACFPGRHHDRYSMIPVVARTMAGMTAARATMRSPVVLVPTMGALHDGHRALLRHARRMAGQDGSVVVSVFVNPLQFGAGMDLDRYPRTLASDVSLCAEEDVAVIFAPLVDQMYPFKQEITVNPGSVGEILEGAFRPGFFTGVLTVVLKIFNLVRPDAAVFGQKDAQQVFLVRRMVADLNLLVDISSVATVREPDGLAASSRNSYLSPGERLTALALSRALNAGAAAGAGGQQAVLTAARAELDAAAEADPPLLTDYLELVDPATFATVDSGYAGAAQLLVAGTVGKTRLIDNALVIVGPVGSAEPSGPAGSTP
ncbi:MAG TPA: pantoate--beta-alanine ligase [Nitrolancea sp.]|nr:pantoate--beta-alanine ligase [Nitrolancea sp.]